MHRRSIQGSALSRWVSVYICCEVEQRCMRKLSQLSSSTKACILASYCSWSLEASCAWAQHSRLICTRPLQAQLLELLHKGLHPGDVLLLVFGRLLYTVARIQGHLHTQRQDTAVCALP